MEKKSLLTEFSQTERETALNVVKEYAVKELNLSEKEFDNLKKTNQTEGALDCIPLLNRLDEVRKKQGKLLPLKIAHAEYILLETIIANVPFVPNRQYSRAEKLRLKMSRDYWAREYISCRMYDNDFVYQALSRLPRMDKEVKRLNSEIFISKLFHSCAKSNAYLNKLRHRIASCLIGGTIVLGGMGVVAAPIVKNAGHQNNEKTVLKHKTNENQR